MIQGRKKDILKKLSETLKDDGYYAIDIMTPGEPRTKGQNDRYNVICKRISEETGYNLAETKAVISTQCFGEPRRSADLNTKDMAILIDTAQQIAAELGIYDTR